VVKILIAITFCLWSINLNAQVLPLVERQVVYEQIDSVSGSNDELFLRSKKWLVNAFRSAKDVIQLDDKESSKLMGKGSDSYYFEEGFNKWPVTSIIYFTLQIDIRDNKARIRIFNIEEGKERDVAKPIETYEYYPKKIKPKIEQKINEKMLGLLASFKTGISKSATDNF
jgi:hypothetical protein